MINSPCQPYLMILNQRLRAELCCCNPDRLEKSTDFIMQFLRVDKERKIAGFAGRSGNMDLYYTAFALRAMGLCQDAVNEKLLKACGNFAKSFESTGAIDLLSELYCLWLSGGRPDAQTAEKSRQLLDKLYRTDGGYAKSANAEISSTYHSFLAMLSWDMLCENAPNVDKTLEFIQSRQCADGGFAEGSSTDSGSVNPTAAALAVMVSAGIITGEPIEKAAEFLINSQDNSGGFKAAPKSPQADLLSSFTAALSLADLGRLDQINGDAAKKFLLGCKKENGGFGAWTDDPDSDAEYTFYGLGLAAILGCEQEL